MPLSTTPSHIRSPHSQARRSRCAHFERTTSTRRPSSVRIRPPPSGFRRCRPPRARVSRSTSRSAGSKAGCCISSSPTMSVTPTSVRSSQCSSNIGWASSAAGSFPRRVAVGSRPRRCACSPSGRWEHSVSVASRCSSPQRTSRPCGSQKAQAFAARVCFAPIGRSTTLGSTPSSSRGFRVTSPSVWQRSAHRAPFVECNHCVPSTPRCARAHAPEGALSRHRTVHLHTTRDADA